MKSRFSTALICSGQKISWNSYFLANFLLHFRFLIVLCVVFMVCLSIANAQELLLLRKIPVDYLHYTGGARPNEAGLVGHNRDGFKSPEFQRGAMHYMILAIVSGNATKVEDAFRAIDTTFAYQTERGNFGQKGTPRGGPSAVAFWLADLCEAILVLRESELEPLFRSRIEEVLPKIKRAARWLAQPRYQERLKQEDFHTPNRLIFDALAYGLAGLLTEDEELKTIGASFVQLAMTQFRRCDGVFLEKGGSDSSYQAVATLKLQVWCTFFPEFKEKYAADIDRAIAWEIGRISDDGQVDVRGNTRTGLGQEHWLGNAKDVNLSEITYCLLYHYAATGSRNSLDAAKRIIHMRQARGD